MKSKLLLILAALIFLVSKPTGTYFSDSGGNTANSFSAVCWDNPAAPILLSPADNSATNAVDVTFSWDASSSSCPIATLEYNFQVYTDSGLTTLYQESGWVSATTQTITSIAEDEYWWVVNVRDQYGNSSISGSYYLIVDRTSPSSNLSVTGSGYKAVEESLTNGGFESGDFTAWTTAGDTAVLTTDSISDPTLTITPYDGTYMARLGQTSGDSGQYVWENRIMTSFPSGAKSLSLYYNYFSRDYAPFDDPGFFIRINGQEVFRLNPESVNPSGLGDEQARYTDWTQFNYNLSNATDSQINLAIYSGNTNDTSAQSFVYIDKITSYFVTARGDADYKITGVDSLSGIASCYYQLDGGAVMPIASNVAFNVSAVGLHNLLYYCVDNAGNSSSTQVVTVITDTSAPSAISDLAVSAIGVNSATLTWTAPGNDGGSGRAASYDVRYSTTNISNDAEFDAAVKVEKVPSPQTSGSTEILEIFGLNPSTTYYFAVKASDEAPNTSGLSNVVSDVTLSSATDNPGDVVINEIMWMGSSLDDSDEWIELRNMTNRTIDLFGWTIEDSSGPIYTFPALSLLLPNDYITVAEYDAAHSRLNSDPDYLAGSGSDNDATFEIDETALELYLYNNSGVLIDAAGDAGNAFAGEIDMVNGKYYSMERTAVPGDGTSALNWYTCIDEASKSDFFDGLTDERGTPGAANRSENEPLAYSYNRGVRSSPKLEISFNQEEHKLGFSVLNIKEFRELKYELSYETTETTEGLMGTVVLNNQEKYERKDLILGTCSSGGACVYHENVTNLKLKVELKDAVGKVTTLEEKL